MGENLYRQLRAHTLGDSMLTCLEYCVKVSLGLYLYCTKGGVMHGDMLAVGGARVVYFGRVAEWSVCIPLVVLLSNRAFLSHRKAWQAMARSAPCLLACFVYTWSAWLAMVSPSVWVRWLMLAIALLGFSIGTADQFVLAFAHWHDKLFWMKLGLVIYQVVLFAGYAAVWTLGRFSLVSSLFEQSYYAYNDATVKVLQGILLAIIRHRTDLLIIRHWWMAALSASHDLEILIQKARLPIFGLDLQGRVMAWNQSLETLTGFSSKEVHKRPLADLISDESRPTLEKALSQLADDVSKVSQSLKAKAEGQSADRIDALWPSSNLVELAIPVKESGQISKQVRQMAMSFVPKLDKEGRPAGFMAVGQDLSEVSELKFVQARKSALMAMLSHEIRSPLHGIMGLSGAMLDSEAGKAMSKQLGMIHACTDRLLDLVTNVMFLAQRERHQMEKTDVPRPSEPVSFPALVDEVMTLTRIAVDKSGRKLLKPTVELVNNVSGKALPLVPGDRQKCAQLLYNLLTNACKFTHNGSITIDATYVAEQKAFEIDVADTGKGISEEGQRRVFQPFEQETSGGGRTFQGIGLGLSVCTEIVKLHGGELRLASELGRGSTFTVSLPCDGSLGLAERVVPEALEEGQEVRVPEGAPSPDPLEHVPPLVLSVDDDEVNQEVVKSSLSDFCTVITAMDGKQALAVLEEASASKGRFPDIILLDIQMPGMTGYECCEKVRSHIESGHLNLPIVMVSARMPYEQTAIKGYNSGMTDFLAKPFHKEVLRRKVRVAMESKAEAKQACGRARGHLSRRGSEANAGHGASVMYVAQDASVRIRAEQKKNEELRDELETMQRQVAEQREEESAGAEKIAAAEERASKAEVLVAELKQKLEQLEQQQQQQQQQHPCVENAGANAEGAEAGAKALQPAREGADARAREAEARASGLQQLVEDQRVRLEHLERQLAGGGQEAREAEARAAGLQRVVEDQRRQIARLERRVAGGREPRTLPPVPGGSPVRAGEAEELRRRVERLTLQQESSAREAESKARLAVELQRRVEELQQDLNASLAMREVDGRAREVKAGDMQHRLHSPQRRGSAELPPASFALPSVTAASPGTPAPVFAGANGCGRCSGLQRRAEALARSLLGARAIVSVLGSRVQMQARVAGQCRELLQPHGAGWQGGYGAASPILERTLVAAQLSLVEQAASSSDELAKAVFEDAPDERSDGSAADMRAAGASYPFPDSPPGHMGD
uniref:histidine kinase n=1 Tax=Alexandrium monilatum TaxID=311494 RepID=A0A7S4T7T9_9DINO